MAELSDNTAFPPISTLTGVELVPALSGGAPHKFSTDVLASYVMSAKLPGMIYDSGLSQYRLGTTVSGLPPIDIGQALMLEVVSDGRTSSAVLGATHHGNVASATVLRVTKSRGTRAAPLPSQSGDNIGQVQAQSHNGTNYLTGGRLAFYATENWSGTARGTGWTIDAVLTGQTALMTQVQGDANGNVAAGLASLATGATGGFFCVPKIAGAPTGTPSTPIGFAPATFDPATNKLWVYNGTAWKSVTLT